MIRIVASRITPVDPWRSAEGVPTFYLDLEIDPKVLPGIVANVCGISAPYVSFGAVKIDLEGHPIDSTYYSYKGGAFK